MRARLTVALASLALLVGCSLPQPFRVTGPDPQRDCTPDAEWRVPQDCGRGVLERSRDYDLLFVEFSDQGLQYPSDPYGNAAAYQINHALGRLEELAGSPGNGLSLIVYVHGWKHNAGTEDDDVRAFRKQLTAAAAVEAARPAGESLRVVGIYVGWRGLSTLVEPFKELSFWTRKNAALHVALGSARELFARLRGFRCRHASAAAGGDCEDTSQPGGRKVRMVLMGHSFGGLVLYNAISGAITERLTSVGGRGGTATPPPWSYGDMVILINPAFEATRYTPLHRIATGIPSYPPYDRPLFLAITTRADLATRVFFPLGRYLNTIFERHASPEERLANRRTMGHVPAYLTHALTAAPAEPCAGWRDPDGLPAPERLAQMRLNNAIEIAHAGDFLGNLQSLPPGWVRTFCGGAVLTHHQHDPVSPIWNVQADRGVMSGHSDISNPVISSFLRQLYRDTSAVAAR